MIYRREVGADAKSALFLYRYLDSGLVAEFNKLDRAQRDRILGYVEAVTELAKGESAKK